MQLLDTITIADVDRFMKNMGFRKSRTSYFYFEKAIYDKDGNYLNSICITMWVTRPKHKPNVEMGLTKTWIPKEFKARVRKPAATINPEDFFNRVRQDIKSLEENFKKRYRHRFEA